MNHLPGIPTQHKMKIEDLGDHEYFGKDFRNGQCSWLVVEKQASNGFLLVAGTGDVSTYAAELGEYVRVLHTQNNRQIRGRVIGIIKKGSKTWLKNAERPTRKISTWTLK